MSLRNPLKETIAAGGSAGCVWLSLGSPAVAELMVQGGPDAAVFDLQHGLWDRSSLEAAIGLVRQRCVPLVRVAENSAHAISTALDAGALGVIVPLVESAEEAARSVAWSRYPPRGIRSGGGVRPLMDFKGYAGAADEAVLVIPMVETVAGVANAGAIAAVPGVDMVFIGTGDLALSLGTFPEFGPRHEAACLEVLAACRAVGTPCGIFTPSATFAMDRRAQGFRLSVLACDNEIVQAVATGHVRRFRTRPDPARVAGAVAFVTGASRGIGAELVRALAEGGARRIYCASRSGAVPEAPAELVPVTLDIADPAQVERAAAAAPDVTLLVNNAGINANAGLIGWKDPGDAQREVATNYLGTLAMCRAFAPVLARNGGGAIVNMLSILAHMNLPQMASLCASKAAALSMTQALRAELSAQGTFVMGVLPGAVDTAMTRDFTGPKIAPRRVADAVVQGLILGQDEVYPGGMAAGVLHGLSLDAKAVEAEFATYLPKR
ncbi:MAG: SDR family NAD(P)-dependent oxidoreductase [Geminicoccaceae bacterium]